MSARAASELLHAEVGWLLARAGIPVLHIKGPTVALWLYDDGERAWGDVDVLVPPSRLDEALEVLAAAGMTEVFAGVNRHTTTDHAVAVARREAAGVVAEVDVHDRFPGIDAEPERAFTELWRRREPGRLAHVDLWLPDLPTRALLVVLNCARSPTPKARGDLERLVAAADADDWADVLSLAARVQALPALRAGLELHPVGREVVASTALAGVAVSTEWRLRLAGAPRTALRLDELRRLSWGQRVSAVGRWLVPAPGVLRMRDPAAAGGPGRLAAAYVRRLGDGARAVPPSLRALRQQRRARARVPDSGAARVPDSSP